MASALAADLTEAYRILVDPELRAKYQRQLRLRRETPEPAPLQWATTPPPHRTLRNPLPRPAPSSRASAVAERPGASVAIPVSLKKSGYICKASTSGDRNPGRSRIIRRGL